MTSVRANAASRNTFGHGLSVGPGEPVGPAGVPSNLKSSSVTLIGIEAQLAIATPVLTESPELSTNNRCVLSNLDAGMPA